MPLVTKWTGREVKALREAVRMSLMEFAEKLGVSDRIVSRWEAGGEQSSLRMVNQAALDTLELIHKGG
jgi:DNA-binding transcriptional regulator YiaG